MEFQTPRWTSYLFTGFGALFAAWAMTGCRIGNRVENHPSEEEMKFKHYDTRPQSLAFCAQLVGDSDATCNSATTNFVPAETSLVMTDVVSIGTHSTIDYALLMNSALTRGFEVFLEADKTFSVRSGKPFAFWAQECVASPQLTIIGNLQTAAPYTNPQGTRISGRLGATITKSILFASGCGPAMAEIAACYQDQNLCNGGSPSADASLHQEVVDYFDPYVRHVGISATEISQIEKLVYEVTYE